MEIEETNERKIDESPEFFINQSTGEKLPVHKTAKQATEKTLKVAKNKFTHQEESKHGHHI